jgi:cytoskeletal protein RodZ
MKTVGQMLQAARAVKKLELDDVARITKIRPQFLAIIEKDDYRELPSGTVARGFIRNYAEFLGLNPAQVLAIFRRDFIENELGQIVPRGFVEPVNKRAFWTPRTSVIAVLVAIFTVFGAYLAYQYYVLIGPPRLEVAQVQESVTTSDTTYEITGETDPEATISVNGQLVALDKGGQFFFRVPLVEGENLITITATSKSGKTATQTRTVTATIE